MPRCWRRFQPSNYWGDGEALTWRCQLDEGHSGWHSHTVSDESYSVSWEDGVAFGSCREALCNCTYDHVGHWPSNSDIWCPGNVTTHGERYEMHTEGY